ncbi:retron system putative HNH endonuclease [Ectothiorhodospira shaposhnikovii]|uniref:retron system putative HNH endonuclease n=1 Tax=Ectothiorhodospira shaposhnikovii TaxID=1054 RepID=UPI001EE8A3EA|nr:retron system putative HNH endonuclease [Ectothiorhodospira shaposhnikovii]MCG5514338.1 TIGR02646 family protein [Ectothiorhodospira shaposhnikovii]
MREIKKQGNGGYHLNQANQTPPKTTTQATSRWSRFNHKPEVMKYLLDEQYHLCCYSELDANAYGIGFHIEHVENKSQNPGRTFDYSNLAASAIDAQRIGVLKGRQQAAGVPTDLFGGHAPGKQGAVDIQRFVSPHQPDCSRFFSYLSDGRIVPKENLNEWDSERAQYTIDVLNLNSQFLQSERKQWWDELSELFNEHLDNEMDLHSLAKVDLSPVSGKLKSFFSMTRQFFGPIAEDVLRHDQPELL